MATTGITNPTFMQTAGAFLSGVKSKAYSLSASTGTWLKVKANYYGPIALSETKTFASWAITHIQTAATAHPHIAIVAGVCIGVIFIAATFYIRKSRKENAEKQKVIDFTEANIQKTQKRLKALNDIDVNKMDPKHETMKIEYLEDVAKELNTMKQLLLAAEKDADKITIEDVEAKLNQLKEKYYSNIKNYTKSLNQTISKLQKRVEYLENNTSSSSVSSSEEIDDDEDSFEEKIVEDSTTDPSPPAQPTATSDQKQTSIIVDVKKIPEEDATKTSEEEQNDASSSPSPLTFSPPLDQTPLKPTIPPNPELVSQEGTGDKKE